ncbi:hypothetical protein Goari_006397 [Gossypium aridum]|uniref:DUF4283 domain-containing protein n=1 Tax=Gossypium aridum TaxID=34290 RepID=A0A7J8XP08_GOSAI|nr:hypothetical protein [Gossypium aridum]
MEADLVALSLDSGEEDAWSFLIANIIQLQAMRTTVANLWHPCGGITISYLGKKRYLFRFYYEFDIERVMDGDPWTFNNHLLVYHQLQLGEDPLRVPLHFVDYWIQVHDLSPGLMSEGIIKQFGAFLGTYIDYDAKPISIGVGGYLCNSSPSTDHTIMLLAYN